MDLKYLKKNSLPTTEEEFREYMWPLVNVNGVSFWNVYTTEKGETFVEDYFQNQIRVVGGSLDLNIPRDPRYNYLSHGSKKINPEYEGAESWIIKPPVSAPQWLKDKFK